MEACAETSLVTRDTPLSLSCLQSCRSVHAPGRYLGRRCLIAVGSSASISSDVQRQLSEKLSHVISPNLERGSICLDSIMRRVLRHPRLLPTCIEPYDSRHQPEIREGLWTRSRGWHAGLGCCGQAVPVHYTTQTHQLTEMSRLACIDAASSVPSRWLDADLRAPAPGTGT